MTTITSYERYTPPDAEKRGHFSKLEILLIITTCIGFSPVNLSLPNILTGAVLIALYVIWSRRDHTVVVANGIDASESLEITITGSGTKKSGPVRESPMSTFEALSASFIIKSIAFAILVIAWSIVVLGRVYFDHSPNRYAPTSLFNEWTYDTEQLPDNEKIINTIYILPDALNLVYEFGFIGRLRASIRKKNKCICGNKDCDCQ